MRTSFDPFLIPTRRLLRATPRDVGARLDLKATYKTLNTISDRAPNLEGHSSFGRPRRSTRNKTQ